MLTTQFKMQIRIQLLNYDLKILEKLSEDWLLQIKGSILWKIKTQRYTTTVFQGFQLEYISSHTHLGLIFSDDLKW